MVNTQKIERLILGARTLTECEIIKESLELERNNMPNGVYVDLLQMLMERKYFIATGDRCGNCEG